MSREPLSAADEVAKRLRKIADEPKATRLFFTMIPKADDLPKGEFILGELLYAIADGLEGKI